MMSVLYISAQENQNAGWDFHNLNSKRKLFKGKTVSLLTAMKTDQSLYLNQLLRMS